MQSPCKLYRKRTNSNYHFYSPNYRNKSSDHYITLQTDLDEHERCSKKKKAPIYNNGLATTAPTNQAGHQMHHTTTCVHKPETVHPNAASNNISPTSTPHQLQPAKATTGGDSKCSKTLAKTFLDFVDPPNEAAYGTKDGGGSAMGGVPRKDSGVEKRPTRRAREKLRVERVAMNMPRRRREMHFARRR